MKWVMKGWGGSCRGGVWWVMQGWGGSCRGGVGWVMWGWGGVGHIGVGWGGVGHVGVGWVEWGEVCHVRVRWGPLSVDMQPYGCFILFLCFNSLIKLCTLKAHCLINCSFNTTYVRSLQTSHDDECSSG